MTQFTINGKPAAAAAPAAASPQTGVNDSIKERAKAAAAKGRSKLKALAESEAADDSITSAAPAANTYAEAEDDDAETGGLLDALVAQIDSLKNS